MDIELFEFAIIECEHWNEVVIFKPPTGALMCELVEFSWKLLSIWIAARVDGWERQPYIDQDIRWITS